MVDPRRTEMGGHADRIQETRWSQLLLAREGDTGQRQAAMGAITEQYWKPVYCFLRRKGFDNETAKDLTQGFFTDVILGRRLVEKADPGRGRFRSLLLTAASNYVNDYRRKQVAASRNPEKGLVSLEGLDAARFVESSETETPEATYHRNWASALLSEVLREVEDSCRRAGQTTHWEVFRGRVFLPIADGSKPEPYAKLCARLHIESADRATTMNVTVKRKFETALRRHVRQLVDSDEQVDDEIRDLMNILSGSSPQSG